jgi:hypothetical protein
VLRRPLLYLYNAAVLLIVFECKLQNCRGLYQDRGFTLSWRRRGEDALRFLARRRDGSRSRRSRRTTRGDNADHGIPQSSDWGEVGQGTRLIPTSPTMSRRRSGPWDENGARAGCGARPVRPRLDGNGFADADDLNSLMFHGGVTWHSIPAQFDRTADAQVGLRPLMTTRSTSTEAWDCREAPFIW